MTQTITESQIGFGLKDLQGLTTAPSGSRVWGKRDGDRTYFAAVDLTQDSVYSWSTINPEWLELGFSAKSWVAYIEDRVGWTEITAEDAVLDLADSQIVMFTSPVVLSGPVPIEVGYGHIEGDPANEVVTLSVDGRGLAFTADRVAELATILTEIADAVNMPTVDLSMGGDNDDTKVYGS